MKLILNPVERPGKSRFNWVKILCEECNYHWWVTEMHKSCLTCGRPFPEDLMRKAEFINQMVKL